MYEKKIWIKFVNDKIVVSVWVMWVKMLIDGLMELGCGVMKYL